MTNYICTKPMGNPMRLNVVTKTGKLLPGLMFLDSWQRRALEAKRSPIHQRFPLDRSVRCPSVICNVFVELSILYESTEQSGEELIMAMNITRPDMDNHPLERSLLVHKSISNLRNLVSCQFPISPTFR